MDYLEFYHSNDMYREYIDRYAEAYGVTVIDALGHSIPQFVGEFIKAKETETAGGHVDIISGV